MLKLRNHWSDYGYLLQLFWQQRKGSKRPPKASIPLEGRTKGSVEGLGTRNGENILMSKSPPPTATITHFGKPLKNNTRAGTKYLKVKKKGGGEYRCPKYHLLLGWFHRGWKHTVTLRDTGSHVAGRGKGRT